MKNKCIFAKTIFFYLIQFSCFAYAQDLTTLNNGTPIGVNSSIIDLGSSHKKAEAEIFMKSLEKNQNLLQAEASEKYIDEGCNSENINFAYEKCRVLTISSLNHLKILKATVEKNPENGGTFPAMEMQNCTRNSSWGGCDYEANGDVTIVPKQKTPKLYSLKVQVSPASSVVQLTSGGNDWSLFSTNTCLYGMSDGFPPKPNNINLCAGQELSVALGITLFRQGSYYKEQVKVKKLKILGISLYKTYVLVQALDDDDVLFIKAGDVFITTNFNVNFNEIGSRPINEQVLPYLNTVLERP